MALDPKLKITKFIFDTEGAHIALTHQLQGFSANNRPDPLIIKSDQIVMNEEILNDVKRIDKAKTEGNPSGDNQLNADLNKATTVVQTQNNKGIKMDKVEIEKSKLEEFEKSAQLLIDLEKKLADQEVLLEKARKAEAEALIKAKVEIVKGFSFVSGETDQVALATALVKVAGLDLDAAKAIETALEKAKIAVEAVVTKEVGHNKESVEDVDMTKAAVSAFINKNKTK